LKKKKLLQGKGEPNVNKDYSIKGFISEEVSTREEEWYPEFVAGRGRVTLGIFLYYS